MSKCIVCHQREAAVPDRNRPTIRFIKRVCRECHAERLRGDLRHALKVHAASPPGVSDATAANKER